MKTKIYEKATEYIESLASSLGVAAEHVYGILVKQQYVTGIADAIFAVIFAIVVTICYKVGKWLATSEMAYRKDWEWLTFIPVLIGVFAIVFMCVSLYSAIGHLVNPEYYAIKEIMDVLKGATD